MIAVVVTALIVVAVVRGTGLIAGTLTFSRGRRSAFGRSLDFAFELGIGLRTGLIVVVTVVIVVVTIVVTALIVVIAVVAITTLTIVVVGTGLIGTVVAVGIVRALMTFLRIRLMAAALLRVKVVAVVVGTV